MKKVAFCIPVYKLRTSHILKYVNEIAEEFDVYVFTQTNWPEDKETVENLAKEDNWKENVYHEVCDCDNIAAKRYCMSNRIMELGYEGMFMCDDDLMFDCITTEGCEKRTTSNYWKKRKISIIETAKRMVEAAHEYDAIYVSPSNNELMTAANPPGTVIVNHRLIWTCLVYIDLIKMKESGIQFIQVFDTFEQHDIQIQFILHGYKTIVLNSYCFVSSQTDTNSAIFGRDPIAHSRKLDTLFMNLFKKYGDYISLHYRNKTKLAHIGCRMKWDLMCENTNVLFYEPKTPRTKMLYDVACEGDLDKFLEALKNK